MRKSIQGKCKTPNQSKLKWGCLLPPSLVVVMWFNAQPSIHLFRLYNILYWTILVLDPLFIWQLWSLRNKSRHVGSSSDTCLVGRADTASTAHSYGGFRHTQSLNWEGSVFSGLSVGNISMKMTLPLVVIHNAAFALLLSPAPAPPGNITSHAIMPALHRH